MLKQISKYIWELSKENQMNVCGRIYGDETLIKILEEEEKTNWSSLRQLRNLASLPGIQKYAIALADVHPGYGAPIGSISAFDLEEGVITFATIGFDINCGVRTLITGLKRHDIEAKKEELADILFREIPAGLGSTGELKLTKSQIDEVLEKGSEYVIEQGFGLEEDLKYTEEKGCIKGADPKAVSDKAKERQFKQVGTLGSGNHYLEVQFVEQIYNEEVAEIFGIDKDDIVISLHCGSRALGHQIGTDYLQELERASKKYNLKILDKELVCAPIQSEEGQKYFSAVNAGINCAFANRQVLTHLVRTSVSKVLGIDEKSIRVLYDVGHNTAKIEKHDINGKMKEVLVGRKGSTRGFGPNREEIPEKYRKVGQPILVGGSMGTASYILRGTNKGMLETFGSAIHGAGRVMSRVKATSNFRGSDIEKTLRKQNIIVKAHSLKGLAEEAPEAYKNIDDVVKIVHEEGVVEKVARLRPIIVVKG
ncbi:MAG: RtcB family protein [Candidatus Diapherotrites archaeon]|nr:RtcB family protein [Candidatus Diapherotrites archaeon]